MSKELAGTQSEQNGNNTGNKVMNFTDAYQLLELSPHCWMCLLWE